MDEYNQREYSRASHFGFEVLVCKDKANWHEARVSDLSSGGLKLHTHKDYEQGETLWFDLIIHGFMSEFTVVVQGSIQRKTKEKKDFVYGIKFLNLSQDIKIRIDENVHNDRPIGKTRYEND